MTSGLRIHLFGGFGMAHDGAEVPGLNAARLQSLLAYLLLQDEGPLSRRHVAFLFWPDLPEDQARNNLRQALHQLRQALPAADQFLYTDANTVHWRWDSPAWLDVNEFRAALDAARMVAQRGQVVAQRAALERVVALYRGELLPSCYDDWIALERERLHQDCLEALESLIGLLEGQRAYAAAIPYARRLVQHDRLHENGHRLLMRLCALNGDRADALRVYHSCADTLQRELGVEPEDETQALYRRLLHTGEHPLGEAPPLLLSAPPLVGRENAWSALIAGWRLISTVGPHLILIEGDAGIGKTRLAEEFGEWAARQGISTARTRAYAAEGTMSYGPLVDWLRSEICRPILASIEAVWRSEIARLLPELLVETPDLPRPEPLVEQWQRQRFHEALARVLLGAQQPLLLLLDDLQWCDRETLEWLHYLLRFDPRARLLVIGTARIEELAGHPTLQVLLRDLRHANQIIEILLEPLDAAESARLAAHVVGADLDTRSALQLYRETEGNPLFVVETMRLGLLSSEDGPAVGISGSGGASARSPAELPSGGLPPRVHSVIAGRLAQLSAPARQAASLAATIGRAFSFEVLVRASGADEDALVRWLDELWQRRIVRDIGGNTYDFTHDKLREVAYAEASPPARARLHRRVARSLEEVHARDLDAVSGQLAVHYDRAGLPEQAISFYHRAAAVAQRVGANHEAADLLRRALTLLPRLGSGPEIAARELDLQLALGTSLVGSLGHGAPEVAEVYARAQTVSEQLGRPSTPPILRALAIFHTAKADFGQTRRYGEQLLALAKTQHDPIAQVEGHYVLGAALSWQGEFATARGHLEEAIASYNPRLAHGHISSYSQDPKVICLGRLAFDLRCLGYPDQAVAVSDEALAYAREIGHPFSQAYAMFWDTLLQNHLRAFGLARDRAEAMIAYCREYNLDFWLPAGVAMHGWALAELGEVQGGIASIQAGMEGWRAHGLDIKRSLFLSLLATQHGRAGNIRHGQVLLDEALVLVERHDERWCEAEVHRRRSELLVLKGDRAAGDAYRRAIAVAQSQDARMLELRATTGLARLLRGRADDAAVRRSLAGVYGWFKEGLELPDLRDAQALL